MLIKSKSLLVNSKILITMDLEIMKQVLQEILQQQKNITADNEKDSEARQGAGILAL